MPYTEQSLPFARGSHTSHKAAVNAGPTRRTVTAKYLDALKAAGTRGLIDAEAAGLLNRPVSSVCSIRNGCCDSGLVRKGGERMGPWGQLQTIWIHTDIRANA
jgi:hypothetical protein